MKCPEVVTTGMNRALTPKAGFVAVATPAPYDEFANPSKFRRGLNSILDFAAPIGFFLGVPLALAYTMYTGISANGKSEKSIRPATTLVEKAEKFCADQADTFARSYPDIEDGYDKALRACRSLKK